MACPICEKETDKAYRPFCSKRCADIDLGRWLNDDYVLPGTGEDEPDDPDDKEARAQARPH